MTAYRKCRNVPARIDRAARADHDAGPTRKGILSIALRYGSEVRGEDAYFEDIPALQLPQDLAHVTIERKAGNFHINQLSRTAHGGGRGVNSSRSSGGRSKRPRPQSALRHCSLAASILSRLDPTKFHQM